MRVFIDRQNLEYYETFDITKKIYCLNKRSLHDSLVVRRRLGFNFYLIFFGRLVI